MLSTIVVAPDLLRNANHCHVQEAELQANLLERTRRFNSEGRHDPYRRCNGKHPHGLSCGRCADTEVADMTETCRHCLLFKGVRLFRQKMVMLERPGPARRWTCALEDVDLARGRPADGRTDNDIPLRCFDDLYCKVSEA